LTIIEGKTAYPYITEFKKEPFISFIQTKRRDIGSFYLSSFDKALNYYRHFNQNLLNIPDLNLENIYWFLLLRKFLGEEKKQKADEFYNFIKKCEVRKINTLGFKFYPNSDRVPDVWSTYFALASLKLLGLLNDYLIEGNSDQNVKEIINFLLSHKSGNKFLHCLNDTCEIDKKTSFARTLYFLLECFTLLGMDVRSSRDKFLSYKGSLKKEPSIVYKLLCFKYLDLENDVNEKTIQYLHEFQKENGGFSFRKIDGKINTTFWVVYTLHNYRWLLDYNPVAIYSFINLTINEILNEEVDRTTLKLMELSKAIILLSIIFKKFIEEVERLIFKQLEKDNYVNFNLIKNNLGLNYGIEEVISYINSNYTFNLKILDNKIEYNNFLRNLNDFDKKIASEIYEKLKKNNIISLKEIRKKYKVSFKESIAPLITKMIQNNFLKGKIVKKRFGKKYFYLDFFIDALITSDTKINLSQILSEKEKIKDIKNDIYNMTLKLTNAASQIKEEIESYLIIDETDYARERLKFILRNALMDADFLNENIESSFNLDLYYIDLQNILKSDIFKWKRLYSMLSKRLNQTDIYLKEKIAEKEHLRNLNKLLEELEDKILNFSESINRKINNFQNILKEFHESEYTEAGFSKITQYFESLKTHVKEFDKKIYKISQNVISKEEIIVQKRNRVINLWVNIQEEFSEVFNYYRSGFEFFEKNLEMLNNSKTNLKNKINTLNERSKDMVKESKYEQAINLIKSESDQLLQNESKRINNIQNTIDDEIKKKRKFYLLYRTLFETSEKFEEEIIEFISNKVQSLENKVIKERNKAKIEDFDNFVAKEINNYKTEIIDFKREINQSPGKKISNMERGFDKIQSKIEKTNQVFLKKLKDCNDVIQQFEQSNFTIVKWNNFYEYIIHEISVLKEEFTNQIITDRIFTISQEKKTSNVSIVELKKELDLKCKFLIERIKDLIAISKLNGELYENEKVILVFNDDYYKNKELRSFIDKKLFKINQQAIGKVLTLYDNSIRKRTLNVNMLELQNRIKELKESEKKLENNFYEKIKELQIDIESRIEYVETKNYFNSILRNNQNAIETISNNLEIFNDLQNFIQKVYFNLNNDLLVQYKINIEEIEKSDEKSYSHVEENCNKRWSKLDDTLKNTQDKIEDELKKSLEKVEDSNKLITELREIAVKNKNLLLKDFQEKRKKVNDELTILKSEVLRERLVNFINGNKIHISQLLGTLQTRVEDDLEIREYKRAYANIHKRSKNIEKELSNLNKAIKNLVKQFNRQSNNFETKNKYVLDDFYKFMTEFHAIHIEKIKALEALILKDYIQMAIKAVSNEYLTIGFLNNELKIKRGNLQDHLINLISNGELKGKYDPRLGIYYENPTIIENLNEDELEVIKGMNFKLYLIYRRLKSFSSLYGSILGLFASILAITYWIYIFSGNNPAVASIPISILLLIIVYYMFKRSKDDTIK
jgi:hypothetical protein